MSRGAYLAKTRGGTQPSRVMGGSDPIEQRRQAMKSMASAGIRSLSGGTTDDRAGVQARGQQRAAGFEPQGSGAALDITIPAEGRITETAAPSGIDTFIKGIINKAKETDFTFPGVLGAFQNLTKELRPTKDSFKNKNFLATLENEFRKGNFNRDEYYDTYKDLIDEAFNIKDEEAAMGRSKDIFNTQTVGAFNEAVAGDLGSDIQQRVDPIGFGRELLDKGGPQTSGQAEEFAKIDLSQLTNSPEDRRLAAAVMEARALAADKQSRQDANMGQGIMAASPALPEFTTKLPSGTPVIEKPLNYEQLLQQYGRPNLIPPELLALVNQPVQAIQAIQTPNVGIAPFDVNKFYASLPEYTQQGVMSPNLAQFYQNLQAFPRVV